jgi:hypothetical protein
MKKVVLGPVRYAADRAFIPVIEEVAEAGKASGAFFARLLSLIVLEKEEVSIYPFSQQLSLTDLLSTVPELAQVMTAAQRSLKSGTSIRGGEPR